jgi:hypothetical protein
MLEPDLLSIMTFETSEDLGQWLKLNHAFETELWIKYLKKHGNQECFLG